jgi:hypothetical protein
MFPVRFAVPLYVPCNACCSCTCSLKAFCPFTCSLLNMLYLYIFPVKFAVPVHGRLPGLPPTLRLRLLLFPRHLHHRGGQPRQVQNGHHVYNCSPKAVREERQKFNNTGDLTTTSQPYTVIPAQEGLKRNKNMVKIGQVSGIEQCSSNARWS